MKSTQYVLLNNSSSKVADVEVRAISITTTTTKG
jgi:hypothetical protein